MVWSLGEGGRRGLGATGDAAGASAYPAMSIALWRRPSRLSSVKDEYRRMISASRSSAQ